MRKIFRAVMLLLVPYFLCGCAITGKIGGWPIFSATATTTTIVNNTTDARFVVLLNGKIINEFYVLPGQDFSFSSRNFSDNEKEYCVVVKAYDADDRMLGVTEMSYTVRQYEAGCKTWVINSYNFRGRK
ncbi:MAG: hypothetical protein AAB389_02665 [Patescibacteria group bacterium]